MMDFRSNEADRIVQGSARHAMPAVELPAIAVPSPVAAARGRASWSTDMDYVSLSNVVASMIDAELARAAVECVR